MSAAVSTIGPALEVALAAIRVCLDGGGGFVDCVATSDQALAWAALLRCPRERQRKNLRLNSSCKF
jgi:hypothetical protein